MTSFINGFEKAAASILPGHAKDLASVGKTLVNKAETFVSGVKKVSKEPPTLNYGEINPLGKAAPFKQFHS